MSTKEKVWDIESYKKSFTKRVVLQPAIFARLEDCNWHCRDCAGTGIGSKQYAGGGDNFEAWRNALNHKKYVTIESSTVTYELIIIFNLVEINQKI